MSCKTSCKLCKNLVISTAVNFDSANNQLIIALPAGAYLDGSKVCIVVSQSIPESTTINAAVVITVGNGATRYPLTDCNCAQATAESIHTRTRYATRVATSATGTGTFKYLGCFCRSHAGAPASISCGGVDYWQEQFSPHDDAP